MEFLYPLNAIHRDGEVILLYTLEEVHKFLAKYGEITEHHVEYYYDFSYHMYRRKANGWIIRDDRGRVVKYEDVQKQWPPYQYRNDHHRRIRAIAEKGLPIPRTGCSKAGRKINHTAMKNSGAGKRNRDRALCEYDRKEYGVKNRLGKPIPWEGW